MKVKGCDRSADKSSPTFPSFPCVRGVPEKREVGCSYFGGGGE